MGVLLLVAAGCTSSPPEGQAPPPGEAKVFEGTPDEYSAVLRACLDDAGLVTEDLPAADAEAGFLLSTQGSTREEREVASASCRQEIGEPRVGGLTTSELRARYDSRFDQFTCLQSAGLVDGEPPTFEVFVDDYERSGQLRLWEPTDGARTVEQNGEVRGPTDVCPRDTSTW